MKKLIVLLLALMLLAGTALAEDGLYISEAPNTSGFSGKSLTPESYPMARLTPFASQIVSGKADAVFLSFPGPDGTNIWDVQSDLVTYLDSENLIRYDYIIYKSNSYEEFINKAEKEEYILLDGERIPCAYTCAGLQVRFYYLTLGGFELYSATGGGMASLRPDREESQRSWYWDNTLVGAHFRIRSGRFYVLGELMSGSLAWNGHAGIGVRL